MNSALYWWESQWIDAKFSSTAAIFFQSLQAYTGFGFCQKSHCDFSRWLDMFSITVMELSKTDVLDLYGLGRGQKKSWSADPPARMHQNWKYLFYRIYLTDRRQAVDFFWILRFKTVNFLNKKYILK